MSKYGRAKYGIHKYGRYELGIPTGQPLAQITKYRLRTIDSLKRESRSIVNASMLFPTKAPVRVRMRTNKGEWVAQQSESILGEKIRLRVKAIQSDGSESSWIESVVGTIRNI